MMDQTLVMMLLLTVLSLLFDPLFAKDGVKVANALTIPLIFPNSPESPLYIKNQTRQQRIEQLVDHTLNRIHSLSLTRISRRTDSFTEHELTAARQEIYAKEGSLILLKVGIGRFQKAKDFETYYMHMDTGIDLTWLQCEDCLKYPNKCFGNPPFVYPSSFSRSYKPIPCGTHELCYKRNCKKDNCTDVCTSGFCSYHQHYTDNSDALGILANETFTFGTGPTENEITRNAAFEVLFGCNIYYDGRLNNQRQIVGVISLGWGPRSLISQISSKIYESFGYCFPHYDEIASGRSKGYFQLGLEADSQQQDFNSTTLLHFQDYNHYYLNLDGISVAGNRLPVNGNVFNKTDQNKDGENDGTLIDLGTPFSTLTRPAYDELKKQIVAYFSSLGNYVPIRPAKGLLLQFELCYRSHVMKSTNKFPSVTFHFTGADMVLTPDNVFIRMDNPRDAFCLAMLPSRSNRTIIGAYQQSNFKFIYDRKKMLLFFTPEDCHVGP